MRAPRRGTVLGVLALVLLAVAVAVPTATSMFLASERHVQIGAHDAVVRPALDGSATIESGPLLPQVRLPIDAPAGIGVRISLGGSEVADLEELVARDAVIASQPEGEIQAVRSTLLDMARAAALRGAGLGVLAALALGLAWRATGPGRRREVLAAARHPSRRQGLVALGTVAAVVGAGALVVVPDRADEPREKEWAPLRQTFPEVPADPVLDRVEISQGTATRGSRALVQGALDTYQASVEFYGDLARTAETIEVRRPEDGETTALVVTDRHNNIGMDPVARAVADRAEARLLINLGDDTSNGGSWEEFSINSLAREFEGFDVVAVAGNHDGEVIAQVMRDRGFEVLDGEPVDVAGVRFLGSGDPRRSGLTAGYSGDESDNISIIEEQDAELTRVACEDGTVAVLAVHSSASARQARASGCVDLVLSGHVHRQVGPAEVEGENGRITTTLTTGSTGGAVYAFALGSKLRRQAQVTVVTFEDGIPVGLQPVTFEPGGAIEVADYVPVETSPR